MKLTTGNRFSEDATVMKKIRKRTQEDKAMKDSRVDEIKNRMTAFEERKYTREEVLNEMFKLQEEMAIIAFGENQAEGKRFYDIVRHYGEKNDLNNKIAGQVMDDFRKEGREASNFTKGIISGRKGENKVAYKLNFLLSSNEIKNNIEIADGENRTEIDTLVITEKAAFIIEVKNTKRDVFIDEAGKYYRTGKYLQMDSNIGKKLELREKFVRQVAEQIGIKDLKIEKVVVFTDNHIKVMNRFRGIRTCFLSQLTSVIDTYQGEKIITLAEIKELMKIIDSSEMKASYVPDFDAEKFKNDFAQLVSILDYQEYSSNRRWWKSWKALVTSIAFRKVAATIVVVGSILTMLGLV